MGETAQRVTNEADESFAAGSRSTVRTVLRVVVALVAFGYAVYRAYGQAQRLPPLTAAGLGYLGLSGVAYAAGLLCCALYWLSLIRGGGASPQRLSVLAAYFVGHLAKYLPGKVWVIVVRSTWPEGPGMNTAMLAMTATQETLLMMGVGGIIGGGVWFLTADAFHPAAAGCAVLAMGSGTAMMLIGSPVLAPLLRRLPRLGRFAALAVQSPGSFARGIAWMVSCWLLLGVSLEFVYAALRVGSPGLLACVVAVSVATSVGFVSMLPGGLGSRELVLAAMLVSYGATAPALVATAMRVVWLGTEIVCSLLFWGLARYWAGHSPSPQQAVVDSPKR